MAQIVKKFKVPSKSEKGIWRQIVLLSDGKMFCDCPAGRMSKKKSCWHIKIVKEQIIKNYAKQNYGRHK